ncbi:SCAN domain-containing protein 3 [Nephila pilipes]|uniref:SCAN domain-containing protein 3 n=1 Tax=Nephila pilipes TaxID=299642 RepID=A0A8X6QQI0_NEPPI|nr:SCAN domain-containing protein 3 [Nephila pilipes]
MVLGKDDKDVKDLLRSNISISRRIEERSEDIEMQLVEKLKTRKFLVPLDESALRDSEAVLITYVKCVDKGDFAEEMLFCKSLESTTSSKHIYNILKTYLNANNIPMKNITSCVEDEGPIMMGKKNGCLKSKNALCHSQGNSGS